MHTRINKVCEVILKNNGINRKEETKKKEWEWKGVVGV